ncbi:MAG: hypothetical protein QF593_05340 [Nitrospinota bacterium]|nr:hypothetical protein [Nitrospinota bacterium]
MTSRDSRFGCLAMFGARAGCFAGLDKRAGGPLTGFASEGGPDFRGVTRLMDFGTAGSDDESTPGLTRARRSSPGFFFREASVSPVFAREGAGKRAGGETGLERP